jgi:ELWxxDGT repeat protein
MSAVLFSGFDANGNNALWVTDGTAVGTHELSGITGAHGAGNGVAPSDIVAFNQGAMFVGQNASGVSDLWVTDGSAGGTHELNINASSFSNLVAFGGEVLFNAEVSLGTPELWVSDGTTAGTHELSVNGEFAGGLTPRDITVFNGELVFAGIGADGDNVWVTDGTAIGTHELVGVNGANSNGLFWIFFSFSSPDFTVFNGGVVFSGVDSNGINGLWVTNGTALGTHEVIGINGANSNGLFQSFNIPPSNPDFTVLNGQVLFSGRNTNGNHGLWVTDGTGPGTHELTGINGASANGLFTNLPSPDFTVLNGHALFAGFATNGSLGLWVTDGTAPGTHELTGVNGANSNGIFFNTTPNLVAFNGEVLFSGTNTNGLNGLWMTDGTAPGTHELTGINGVNPNRSGFNPSGFTIFTPNVPPPGPNSAPPAATTADMILRCGAYGLYEIYDIGNNAILAGYSLGQVGTDWQFAGLGGFFGSDTTDLVLRNVNSGAFEVYDIANNQLTGAAPLGSVGLDWSLVGFAADPPTASTGRSGSTSQIVQAMAGFGGGSGAADTSNSAALTAETSQQSFLTTPQHA